MGDRDRRHRMLGRCPGCLGSFPGGVKECPKCCGRCHECHRKCPGYHGRCSVCLEMCLGVTGGVPRGPKDALDKWPCLLPLKIFNHKLSYVSYVLFASARTGLGSRARDTAREEDVATIDLCKGDLEDNFFIIVIIAKGDLHKQIFFLLSSWLDRLAGLINLTRASAEYVYIVTF